MVKLLWLLGSANTRANMGTKVGVVSKGLYLNSFAEATGEAAGSLLTALFVSITVYVLPIAQVGEDLSQSLALLLPLRGGALGEPTAPAQKQKFRPLPDNWVFIDIGPRLCGPGGLIVGCPPSKQNTDYASLSTLLKLVRGAQPRVLVVDIDLDATAPGADEMLKTLEAPGRPILLAWSPNDPHGQNEELGEDSPPIVDTTDHQFLFNCTAVCPIDARYAPATRIQKGAVARTLTPYYDVLSKGRLTPAPGIALAAALVTRASVDRPWELLDQWKVKSNGRSEKYRDCILNDVSVCLHYYSRTTRLFSFPQSQPGQNYAPYSPKPPHYTRLTPSTSFLTDSALPPQLADAVVVIGDSRAEAGDRTWTAIGSQSGAELILNDIRQFAIGPPIPPSSTGEYLLREIPSFTIGSLAIFTVNFSLGVYWPKRKRRTHSRGAQILPSPALRLIVRVGAVFLVTAGALLPLLLPSDAHFAKPIDVVTPYIGLTLESLIELTGRLGLCVKNFISSNTELACRQLAIIIPPITRAKNTARVKRQNG